MHLRYLVKCHIWWACMFLFCCSYLRLLGSLGGFITILCFSAFHLRTLSQLSLVSWLVCYLFSFQFIITFAVDHSLDSSISLVFFLALINNTNVVTALKEKWLSNHKYVLLIVLGQVVGVFPCVYSKACLLCYCDMGSLLINPF
jgi:hypothetical protein